MSTHYPTKRSVLVPMLLYIQDEVGAITDEVVAEMAQRVDLTELEVRNVVSYYSMMRTHAIGKYNLQVCTNVSCLLRGGEEILEHCKRKLGVGNKQSTPGRVVPSRRGRMHWRLLLGPGHAVELRVSREPHASEGG